MKIYQPVQINVVLLNPADLVQTSLLSQADDSTVGIKEIQWRVN